MIIVCENCKAKYMVPPNSLGESGRNVKCAKCGETWFAKPTIEEIEKSKNAIEPPKNNLIDKKNKLPTVVEDNIPKILKIIPVVFLFIILIISTIFFKNVLVNMIPKLEYLYEIAGVTNTEKILLRDVSIRKIQRKIGKDLVINGKIYNASGKNKITPEIRIIIYNRSGEQILEHVIASSGRILAPGEYQSFDSNIKNLHSLAEILKLDIGNKLELSLR